MVNITILMDNITVYSTVDQYYKVSIIGEYK